MGSRRSVNDKGTKLEGNLQWYCPDVKSLGKVKYYKARSTEELSESVFLCDLRPSWEQRLGLSIGEGRKEPGGKE